jgi:hypothetical protein
MKIKGLLALAGVALALGLGAGRVEAQGGGFGGPGGGGGGGGGGRGGFDPQQIRQLIMDNIRTNLEVTDDGEWKVIGDQVQKVFDAQLQSGFGGGVDMMRMFRRNNPQGGGNGQNGPRRAGGMAAMLGVDTADPEGEALPSAIDKNAQPAELKAAIAKVAAARAQKQAKLEQARKDLRQLLSVRQEAIAVSMGLL